jgi:hypothetical protein
MATCHRKPKERKAKGTKEPEEKTQPKERQGTHKEGTGNGKNIYAERRIKGKKKRSGKDTGMEKNEFTGSGKRKGG